MLGAIINRAGQIFCGWRIYSERGDFILVLILALGGGLVCIEFVLGEGQHAD